MSLARLRRLRGRRLLAVATRVLFDTSVYIAALRDLAFAAELRPRYLRELPRTSFCSVVIEELLAGARTPLHRKQAAALYEPFEQTGRVITPAHVVWKEAGTMIAKLALEAPEFVTKLRSGLLNDILIALTGRSHGALVVTRNGEDFRLIRCMKDFKLEVL
ncbi:MAG: type II toxin-antitoxin system VapC family toxin [Myxococcales bacterium]|nr:type II toxin-antitoxin system VapC family toxin [Myxococcales bacterium]